MKLILAFAVVFGFALVGVMAVLTSLAFGQFLAWLLGLGVPARSLERL